ncbi:hypothetical protein P7K49_001959 [Saguinus oedipus]|uniref:Uncharacterized protein n=1 Tax=Saguinus oedipus TaxID=9490 RepID=A0ABQ9WG16_SAGOE|nr:hypothetical protein P7K49_001959 [Saguinus oedipus]
MGGVIVGARGQERTTLRTPEAPSAKPRVASGQSEPSSVPSSAQRGVHLGDQGNRKKQLDMGFSKSPPLWGYEVQVEEGWLNQGRGIRSKRHKAFQAS